MSADSCGSYSRSFVLVVEDHPLVAESLVTCIRNCDGGLEVLTAETLRGALAMIDRRAPPILIVTDLSLTDAAGDEAIVALSAAAPGVPLLVVTALDEPALRESADRLGIAGFFVKSTSIQLLRERLQDILGGSGDRPPPVLPKPPLAELLTPKQLSVLEELAAGHSNGEIAARLRIGRETVNSHVKEIFSRLGVKNRTEAVVRYIGHFARQGARRQ